MRVIDPVSIMADALASPVHIHERVRHSSIIFALRMFLLLLAIDTAFAALVVVYLTISPPSTLHYSFIVSLWILHTAKFVLLSFLVIRFSIFWIEQTTYIDNNLLVLVRGILRKHERFYNLNHLKSITLNQNWIGKKLGFGDIELLFSSSGFTEKLKLSSITKPHHYERIFHNMLASNLATAEID